MHAGDLRRDEEEIAEGHINPSQKNPGTSWAPAPGRPGCEGPEPLAVRSDYFFRTPKAPATEPFEKLASNSPLAAPGSVPAAP